VGDPLEEYARILETLGWTAPGAVTLRPAPAWAGIEVADSLTHPWKAHFARHPATIRAAGTPGVSLDPMGARVFLNTGYPWGQNHGAIWQGKGLTTAVDAGVTAAFGPLTITLHPQIIYNQNGDFPLAPVERAGITPDAPLTAYSYPWRPMDQPQRFGPDAFWTLDPGRTSVRLNWRGVSASFGTESLWWGPGVQNGILMSDNAPGFPHAALTTAHPVDIGIGKVEAQWIWGRPQASKWADTVPAVWYQDHALTDTRFLTGTVVSFKPRGMAWMTLGVERTFIQMVPAGGLGAGDYLAVFQGVLKSNFMTPDNPTGEDARDQMFALFARWARPGSGFEVYTEWARNDHAQNLRDMVLQPEHSQGYTLGLRQVLPLRTGRLLSVQAELTHLEKPSTSRVLDYGSYYAHWAIPAGYTQRGQVIGAAVGPGGDGQFIGVDLYAPWGRAGFFLQRQVRDNDAYWEEFADSLGACCHDASVGGGFRSLWLLGSADLGFDLTATREFNRYFVWDNNVWNLNLGFSLRGHRRDLTPR
jgi:hypothetical protein